MNFILILIFTAGMTNGGITSQQIEFSTAKSCAREMIKFNEMNHVTAYCVNRSK